MPPRVTIHAQVNTRLFDGLEDFLRTFDPAAARSATEAADDVLRKHFAAAFDSEGKATGPNWAPLSPEYRKQKDRWFGKAKADFRRRMDDMAQLPAHYQTTVPRGFGRDLILELTGELRRSFTQSGGDHVAEARQTGDGLWTIRIGSRHRLAQYHQEGGSHLPARPIVRPTPELVSALADAIRKALLPHVERRIRAAARIAGMRAGA